MLKTTLNLNERTNLDDEMKRKKKKTKHRLDFIVDAKTKQGTVLFEGCGEYT